MNIEDYFIFIYFLIGLDGETEGNVFMIFIYDLIKLKSNCKMFIDLYYSY